MVKTITSKEYIKEKVNEIIQIVGDGCAGIECDDCPLSTDHDDPGKKALCELMQGLIIELE